MAADVTVDAEGVTDVAPAADAQVLVVVTGGSGGLGRALLATAPAGSWRVDVSRSGPPPEADAHVRADLADPSALAGVATRIAEHVRAQPWSRVVVVHNAATVEPLGFAGEVDTDAYTSAILLNAVTPMLLGHLLLPVLSDRGGATDLTMISSGAARGLSPGWSTYGASKAAVDQWVRTVGAEQTARGGVRVLAISPGTVATAMQERLRAAAEHDFPRVAHYRGLHEEEQLIAPLAAARRVWRVLDDPAVMTGEVISARRH